MIRVLVALYLLCRLTTPLFAQSKKCVSPLGRELWAAGVKAYNLSEYQTAVDNWAKAYDLCPDPELLFNLAQAHRKQNHHQKARDLYKSWLREVSDPDPAEKADVEKKIADLDKLIAAEKVNAESPPTKTKPPPLRRATNPKEGTRWFDDSLGWTVAGSGAGLMIGGGVVFLWGNSIRDDAAATRDVLEVERMIEEASTYRTVGAVIFWTGAALAVAGGLRLVLHESRPDERDDVALMLSPHGFAVSGSF